MFNISFEDVSKFQYLATILKNPKDIRDEMSSLQSGKRCYYSVLKMLSFLPLFKTLNNTAYKIIILSRLSYGCETLFLTVTEEHELHVLKTKCTGEHWTLKVMK